MLLYLPQSIWVCWTLISIKLRRGWIISVILLHGQEKSSLEWMRYSYWILGVLHIQNPWELVLSYQNWRWPSHGVGEYLTKVIYILVVRRTMDLYMYISHMRVTFRSSTLPCWPFYVGRKRPWSSKIGNLNWEMLHVILGHIRAQLPWWRKWKHGIFDCLSFDIIEFSRQTASIDGNSYVALYVNTCTHQAHGQRHEEIEWAPKHAKAHHSPV